MQILVQHFQCWCYSYPTSTCLTAKATSVLTHLIKLNCKKMDKAEGEEIAKIIKHIETDKDDEGVELTLDEIL